MARSARGFALGLVLIIGCSVGCASDGGDATEGAVCGNGVLENRPCANETVLWFGAAACGDEQCDDGNTQGGDGCSATCQNEPRDSGADTRDGGADLPADATDASGAADAPVDVADAPTETGADAGPEKPALSCKGLAALWNFEEGSGMTAADSSGHDHDLTLTGAGFDEGKVGAHAASFAAGAGASASTPYHADFATMRELTIAAWIKPTSSGLGGIAVKASRGGPVQDWGFYQSGSEIVALFNWPSAGETLLSSAGAGLATDTWSFVAMVLDVGAGTVSFYKDGTFVSSAPWTSDLLDNPEPITLGSDGAIPHDFLGSLDAVSVWTRALAADEVALLYADSVICAKP